MDTADRSLDADEGPVDLGLFEGLPRGIDRVLLYEGLPPPVGWKKFREAWQRTDIIELNGWSFYSELLPLHKEHADELTALFSDPQSFRPYRGGKRCVFHPDYCLEWRLGSTAVRAQICLT